MLAPMELCGACRAARYCSEACQRRHWPVHKLECATKKQIMSDAGFAANRAAARRICDALPRLLQAHLEGKAPGSKREATFRLMVREAMSRGSVQVFHFYGDPVALGSAAEQCILDACSCPSVSASVEVVPPAELMSSWKSRGDVSAGAERLMLDPSIPIKAMVTVGADPDDPHPCSMPVLIRPPQRKP